MRNSSNARTRCAALNILPILFLCMAAGPGGCASDQKSKTELAQGYATLDAGQYDQAIAQSDAFLEHTPHGPGSAEALYLRGRALQKRSYPNMNEAVAGWQQARGALSDAMGQKPSSRLETLIRCALANAAYFLDDYGTAASEWTRAYDTLDDDAAKSWVLYRVGICRQRQGQFADADTAFAAVQQRFPNTVPAQRAREHQGQRNFSVQLATFATPGAADAAVAGLQKDGVGAAKRADAKGRNAVFVGPVSTYQQALSLKSRYAGKYPDALIVP